MALMRRTGTKIWYCRFRVRGRWVVKSCRTTDKDLARAAQELIRSEAREANEHKESPKRGKTHQSVGEFFTWYMGIADLKPNSRTAYSASFYSHILPVLRDISLPLITPEDCQNVVDQAVAKGLKAPTVNLARSIMCAMFGAAEKWSYIKSNPTKFVKKLKEVRFKQHILSLKERNALLAEASQESATFRAFIEVAINTGMRRGEILNLRISDLDVDNEQIYVDHLKTKARIIPINSTLRPVAHYLVKEAEAHPNWDNKVFPFSAAAVAGKFAKVRKLAGIKCRFHDLRHTFATTALRRGANAVDIMYIMGHSSLATTLRYMVSGHGKEVVELMAEEEVT